MPYAINLDWNTKNGKRPKTLVPGDEVYMKAPGSFKVRRERISGSYIASYCLDDYYREEQRFFDTLVQACQWCEHHLREHVKPFLKRVSNEPHDR